MNNPYITTYLTTGVRILPREMDNNIRKYIKTSLEKEHINKCFQDTGFIIKIHEIDILNDGYIIPEDPMCCANFNVRFLCTLCRPINNTFITAKISGMSEKLLLLTYGPLHIIINTINNINRDTFMFNQSLLRWTAKKKSDKKDKTVKENTQKYIVLKNDSYVKVKILSKKIIDKTTQIICLGFLEDIAIDTDIEQSIKDIYEPKKYDSIDDFINVEKEIQDAIAQNVKIYTVDTENATDEENDL